MLDTVQIFDTSCDLSSSLIIVKIKYGGIRKTVYYREDNKQLDESIALDQPITYYFKDWEDNFIMQKLTIYGIPFKAPLIWK